MAKALIVIDMQEDFVTGSLANDAALAIVETVRAKIKEAQENENIVIFTRDTHGEDYMETQEGKNLPVPHCIKDTDGWRIYDNLDACTCGHVDKPTFGFNRWGNVLGHVVESGKIDEIELVGVCTSICVVSNALILKATFPETKVTVDASACACLTPETHAAALTVMKTCQVNVINEN